MVSAPRYTHTFSMSENEETILRDVLAKMGGKFGIKNIIMTGIHLCVSTGFNEAKLNEHLTKIATGKPYAIEK